MEGAEGAPLTHRQGRMSALAHPNFTIDPTATISPLADLEPSKRISKLTIGPRVSIDAFAKIKFAGGDGDITIGSDCRINSTCVIYCGNGVSIGNDVLISAGTILIPADHAYLDSETPVRLQGFLANKGGVVIEDDCWIGANSVLLDGAHLRRGVVVRPGTVIDREVPAYSVIGGNPFAILETRHPLK
jgi:virginiamycin A acetyltransferase